MILQSWTNKPHVCICAHLKNLHKKISAYFRTQKLEKKTQHSLHIFPVYLTYFLYFISWQSYRHSLCFLFFFFFYRWRTMHAYTQSVRFVQLLFYVKHPQWLTGSRDGQTHPKKDNTHNINVKMVQIKPDKPLNAYIHFQIHLTLCFIRKYFLTKLQNTISGNYSIWYINSLIAYLQEMGYVIHLYV